MVELLAACDRFTRETDGVFAPLVGGALIAWGYEVSRDERPPGTAASPAAGARSGATRSCSTRSARHGRGAARRAARPGRDREGVELRPSGRRSLRELSDEPSLLVEAGGDLVAARGDHVVAIEDPRGPDHPPATHVLLREGEAVCTSGWSRRHWTNADGIGGAPPDRPGAPGCPRRAARRP